MVRAQGRFYSVTSYIPLAVFLSGFSSVEKQRRSSQLLNTLRLETL